MAKLYILTDEQIKTGKRPKTPRDKMKIWRAACLILTSLVILEHLVWFWMK